MQLLCKATSDAAHEAALTRQLVEAIAEEVRALYGTSRILDWECVDAHLSSVVEQVRLDLRRIALTATHHDRQYKPGQGGARGRGDSTAGPVLCMLPTEVRRRLPVIPAD
jgi:hypothetical protein